METSGTCTRTTWGQLSDILPCGRCYHITDETAALLLLAVPTVEERKETLLCLYLLQTVNRTGFQNTLLSVCCWHRHHSRQLQHSAMYIILNKNSALCLNYLVFSLYGRTRWKRGWWSCLTVGWSLIRWFHTQSFSMEFACFSVCAWGCNTEHVKVWNVLIVWFGHSRLFVSAGLENVKGVTHPHPMILGLAAGNPVTPWMIR